MISRMGDGAREAAEALKVRFPQHQRMASTLADWPEPRWMAAVRATGRAVNIHFTPVR